MKDRLIWVICILALILGIAYSRGHKGSVPQDTPPQPQPAHIQ